jgi:hypothetical protein
MRLLLLDIAERYESRQLEIAREADAERYESRQLEIAREADARRRIVRLEAQDPGEK